MLVMPLQALKDLLLGSKQLAAHQLQPCSQQAQRCLRSRSSRQMQMRSRQLNSRQQTWTQLVPPLQQKSRLVLSRCHLQVLQRQAARQGEEGLQHHPQEGRA